MLPAYWRDAILYIVVDNEYPLRVLETVQSIFFCSCDTPQLSTILKFLVSWSSRIFKKGVALFWELQFTQNTGWFKQKKLCS